MFAYLLFLAALLSTAIIVTIKLNHVSVLYFVLVELIVVFGIVSFLVTGKWI